MDWRAMITRDFISVFGFLILLLFARANNKLISRDRKLFYWIVATGILELIAFEAELYTASLAEPTFWRILFSVLGYTLRPILIYQLVIISSRDQFQTKLRKILLAIPCVLCFLCVSTAFFSQIAFWYDSANSFHRGILGYFPHIIGALYFFMYAFFICKTATSSKSNRLIAFSVSFFAVCLLIIDTFISAGGLTRIGIMLCTFFSFVQTQNKSLFSMIDDLKIKNDEVSLLMNQIGKIVCIYDIPTKTLTMTDQYAKLRGFKSNTAIVPDETVSNNLVSEESEAQYIDFYNKIFAGEHSGNIIAKFRSPNGDERWEKTDFITVSDNNGKPQRAVISIEDITMSYTEKLLLENYRSTLDSMFGDNELCILYDLTERRVIACEGALLPDEVIRKCKALEDFSEYLISKNYIKDCDCDIIRELMSHDKLFSSYRAGVMQKHVERVAVFPNGDEKWFRLTVNIDHADGKNIIASIMWDDIDSEYRAKNDLITRANYDALTGVFTRSAVMNEIEDYISGDGKAGIHALIMLDMDNLKEINDQLGHQLGDSALQNFALELKNLLPPDAIIGRIGGDEFFVFIKNISGNAISSDIRNLLRNLERVYSYNGMQCTVTASVGIAIYHGSRVPQPTLIELYSQADAALYKSKSQGKNSFTFADESDVTAADASSAAFMKNDSISYSLRGLINNLANGIAIFHGTAQSSLRPVLCNDRLLTLLEIEQDRFITHMSVENGYAIHPDDLEQAKATLRKTIDSNSSIRQVFRIITGNGDSRYVTVFSNVHHLENGGFDLYCVFSDADEAEQLHKFQEQRRRQLEKRLIHATNKNEAYLLLNITQNICMERFQTHVPQNNTTVSQSATDVLEEIANDIAIEEYRNDFCERFSVEAFSKDFKEGIVSKEIRVPFKRENHSAQWYLLKTELSFEINSIEVFITFRNIDNEIYLENTINRLLNDDYEYICQIDINSGNLLTIGNASENRMLVFKNGDARYIDSLEVAMEKLLPAEHRKNGLKALSLNQVILELENKDRYFVVFPVNAYDGREERLCQWSFEYTDASHNSVLLCRKNISSILEYGYDSLTGMLGRKGFYREIQTIINKNLSTDYFIAEIDFDKFGAINKSIGFSEGNRFIRQFGSDASKRLQTKGSDCYVAHFEGDHFVFLCSVDCIENPEELYDDIVSQLKTYPEIYRLNVRMGIYMIDDRTLSAELMCDCAHVALEACKGLANRNINYYTSDLNDKLLNEQLLVSELQNALDTEQFEIWFQPQINHGNNGSLIGAEVLARWRHPEKGMISPAVFIPLFEQNGVIYEFDKYIWRLACKCLRKWIDEGLEPLPISVNISRIDILHTSFLKEFSALVEEYNIPHELLHLEITESAFTDNTVRIVDIVNSLIKLGFIVVIDDFGSGYSSLSMLKNVPAHIIKLDMSFFSDESNNTRNECIVDSIIRMAKMLGMSVLAEGVEYIEQADFLYSMGCEYIQGYLYSKPLPYSDYVEYFKNAHSETVSKLNAAEIKNRQSDSEQSQELFRNIISGTNDIIFVADINTKQLLYANRAAEQYYNKSFDPLKMITCTEYCDKHEICKDCPAHGLKLGEKKELTLTVGDAHFKSLYTRIEWNGHDAFVYYQSDISAEVREKELFDSLIKNIPGAIIAFSLNDENEPTIKYVSQQAVYVFEATGKIRESFVFDDFINVIHPDDRQRILDGTMLAFSQKRFFREKFRIPLKNKNVLWIELTMNPVVEQNGKFQFYGIFSDVTMQKNFEDKTDSIIQSIPSAMTIYAINNEGMSRIFISDRAKKILGSNEDTHDKISMDIVYSRIHPNDRERIRSITTECIRCRKPFCLQFRINDNKTEYRWVQLDSTPIMRSDDECFFYSIYTDINAEKQIENELQTKQNIIFTQDIINSGLKKALTKQSPDESIACVLDFLGRSLGCDRSYVFEKNADGTDSNTFEWVSDGVAPQKHNLQNIHESIAAPWYDAFKAQGVIVVDNLNDIKLTHPKIYEMIAPQGINTLVVAPFFDNSGNPIGFFGLDNPQKNEMLNYPALVQTIAYFIEAAIKRRTPENR